jgi:hypothetical protein
MVPFPLQSIFISGFSSVNKIVELASDCFASFFGSFLASAFVSFFASGAFLVSFLPAA